MCLSNGKRCRVLLLISVSCLLAYLSIDLALSSNAWIALVIAFPTWMGVFAGSGTHAHDWGTDKLEPDIGFYVGFIINILILAVLYFWVMYYFLGNIKRSKNPSG